MGGISAFNYLSNVKRNSSKPWPGFLYCVSGLDTSLSQYLYLQVPYYLEEQPDENVGREGKGRGREELPAIDKERGVAVILLVALCLQTNTAGLVSCLGLHWIVILIMLIPP